MFRPPHRWAFKLRRPEQTSPSTGCSSPGTFRTRATAENRAHTPEGGDRQEDELIPRLPGGGEDHWSKAGAHPRVMGAKRPVREGDT